MTINFYRNRRSKPHFLNHYAYLQVNPLFFLYSESLYLAPLLIPPLIEHLHIFFMVFPFFWCIELLEVYSVISSYILRRVCSNQDLFQRGLSPLNHIRACHSIIFCKNLYTIYCVTLSIIYDSDTIC